jgi:GNAT superfamily N-acetyltransferase
MLKKGTLLITQALHWRSLTMLDLPAVEAIATQVHPQFPEEIAILAERLWLYPDGAHLLELDGAPSGYILSHPWRSGTIPLLNAPLGALPKDPDIFYIHDLALLNHARGTGAAAMIVGDILRHARALGYNEISLVAVNRSQAFWHKHGFRAVALAELAAKLSRYEATATYMRKLL